MGHRLLPVCPVRAVSGLARARSALGALCTGGAVLLGCDTTCGEADREPILYTDGVTAETAAGRVFMTSAWQGTWLHFPSNRRFLLEHRLGTLSYTPHAYLSFVPRPASDEGKFSEAAGNEVVFESLDEDAIQVKNDTCSEFYLLVRIDADAPSNGEAGGGG